MIGRKFKDSSVQSDMKYWPFNVVDDATKPKLEVDYKGETKQFFPEEISSMVLNKMKETAEAFLGKVIVLFVHFNLPWRLEHLILEISLPNNFVIKRYAIFLVLKKIQITLL